ncbi:hypothetical protein RJ641_003022 [Dillenia turbinata]|uniref:Protein PHYTOCHROME KINASE SUBSTRATE 1-like n=1 Tax=Dillenia turbinata TaxID=194707 RepID=A0AAN8Z918_9MAGN
MATVTLTSACNTKLPQTLATNNNINNKNHLLDVSFSSYLNKSEEAFVFKLGESSSKLNSINSTQQEHLYSTKQKTEDGEIGIFGAEKYFNGIIEEETPRIVNKSERTPRYKKEEEIGTEQVKPKVQPGTPSVRSESSWNSQSALLQAIVRNPSRNKASKVNTRKSFLASLACNCACSDKKSVETCDHNGEVHSSKRAAHDKAAAKESYKTSLSPTSPVKTTNAHMDSWVKEDLYCQKLDKLGIGIKREECFSFPVLNSGVAKVPVKLQPPQEEEEEEQARNSIEVFGSPILEKRNKSTGIDKSLTMTWDAIPRAEELKIPQTSIGITNTDVESDASSDLFEIENLSCSTDPYLTRQASDGMSSSVTPTCYEPSEASIQWSVVTASAADFSAMSDTDDQRSSITAIHSRNSAAKVPTDREIQRVRPGILLGCKSYKAVRVASNAHKPNEKSKTDPRKYQASDSFTSMTRFPAEAKVSEFDSRHRQHTIAARSLGQSHSARAPNLLCIQ